MQTRCVVTAVRDIEALSDVGLSAPDWADALRPVAPVIAEIEGFLAHERSVGHQVLPAPERVFAALRRPLAEVRVLVVGQDPYPTPGHSIGLAFAVDRSVRPLPASLRNIFRELHDDLGIAPAVHGDLSAWANQGVLLLNRVLTVRAGESASHRRHGWEAVTEQVIRSVVDRGTPLVGVLWGNDARALAPVFHGAGVPLVESAHPSPLSASRGFFGSRPFSRVNEHLRTQGSHPVDWRLPE